MKIVTYNVMFNDIVRNKRTDLLLYLLQNLDADIVCLQEVTDSLKVRLETLPYNIIDMTPERRYREIVLYKNKYKILTKNVFHLYSNMERVINKITFIDNDNIFDCITFHLESLDSSYIRKYQIETLLRIIDKKIPCIVLGDTNLKKGENGLEFYDKSFIDVWKFIGEPCRGEITSHGNRYFGTNVEERYDRVWVTRDSGMKISSFTLLGRKPVENVWISDHDGIMVELEKS